ncbi:hypothetical protein PoB_001366400 [Plakobranchus ocellatus]|uniref:Uncharacterized protein n=1 Tax=Plakobranchus ocellatus TaxID=259542 RepID=A0AAV3YZF4_9GAST|nr:hypothetical protein PoB_001366400 [Plakobranchus ocellatus]
MSATSPYLPIDPVAEPLLLLSFLSEMNTFDSSPLRSVHSCVLATESREEGDREKEGWAYVPAEGSTGDRIN